MTFGHSSPDAMAVFVLLSRAGIAFAFAAVTLATPMVFPVILRSTAFGVCNVIARFISIGSPLIAETQPPLPFIAFSVTAIVGVAGSLLAPSQKPGRAKE